MKNLLEVVFESIDKSSVIPVLNKLCFDTKQIISAECNENFELMKDGHLNLNVLETVLNFNENITVFLKIKSMIIEDVPLSSVLLRIVKYDDQFDIDFSFDANEIQSIDIVSLMKRIHSFSKNISEEFRIANFFGGVEPASDETTRYFTRNVLGPMI